MTCTDPIEILDVQSYLPSYGETSFECYYEENGLVFTILYDDENSNDLKRLELTFEYPVSVDISSFPGPSLLDCHYNSDFLGSLVEFTKSELRDKWEKHITHSLQLKHFGLLLLNANKRLEIICKDVKVSNP